MTSENGHATTHLPNERQGQPFHNNIRYIDSLHRSIGNHAIGILLKTGAGSPQGIRAVSKYRVQMTPSPSAEGAAQTGDANPGWIFQKNMEGRGLRMNPRYWEVIYHLRSDAGEMPISNSANATAYENVQTHLARNPAWRANRSVPRIEIRLLRNNPSVTAVAAAQDLTSAGSARQYAFECYTAASLVQYSGVLRGLERTEPTTAHARFNREYADYNLVIQNGGNILQMGGSRIVENLGAIRSFRLGELLNDPADRGLERGDWVYLNNGSFIARGAFQGENATYLGGKRFYGHGIGTFHINEYVRRLRVNHGVRLTEDAILREVVVSPYYRAPLLGGQSAPQPATATP